MKKKLKIFSIVLLGVILLSIHSSVYATQYAYSMGVKYASSLPYHAGDDFTTNMKNAANIYGSISGIKSYYNDVPTYTYMRGNNSNGNRKIASYIVFANGHSSPNFVTMPSKDTDEYRTGIYTGTDTTMTMEGRKYTFAGLSSTNMNSSKVIIFAGCSTGAWPNYGINTSSTNLPLKAVERGANVAVGFRDNVTTRYGDGPNWLNKFNTCLKNGYGIDGAITAACTAYPNCDLSKHAMAEGNIYSVIVPVRASVFAENELKSQYNTISNDGIKFNSLENNINNEQLSDHIEEFNSIIQRIKEYDSSFNIEKYKVTYNKINPEHRLEHIFFTEYLNGNIETNKVYLVVIKNGVVDDIILSGITKNNLTRAKSYDISELNNRINQFEINKIDKIKNNSNLDVSLNLNEIKLDLNKNVQLDKSISDINNIEEKYYYDYNTKELKYIMKYVKNTELDTKDVEEMQIIL